MGTERELMLVILAKLLFFLIRKYPAVIPDFFVTHPELWEELEKRDDEEIPPDVEVKLEPKDSRGKIVELDRGESFWSARELAIKLGCTRSYIYKMIDNGKIKAIQQGRLIKISPDEVWRVLAEGL